MSDEEIFRKFTPDQKRAYEIGYADGESSGYADWIFAMTEYLGLPDEIDGPTETAQFIATHPGPEHRKGLRTPWS